MEVIKAEDGPHPFGHAGDGEKKEKARESEKCVLYPIVSEVAERDGAAADSEVGDLPEWEFEVLDGLGHGADVLLIS